MKIGCAILAGGKSSRMGTDKALLEYDGKQFIMQIAEELSWFDERIIARGSNCGFGDEIARQWKVIPDIYPDHGPIGGLHAALSCCETDALFVVTCDMPLIKSELVRKLCMEMQKMDAGRGQTNRYAGDRAGEDVDEQVSGDIRDSVDAVIAVGADDKIHPLCGVYRKSTLPVLEEQIISGQNRVMASLKKLHVKYVTIDSPSEACQISNINTPQDYEILKNQR